MGTRKGSIRKRGQRYYAEVCIRGKRKGKSHNTLRQARAWIQEAEAGEISLAPKKGTLGDLVERYIREIGKDHKGERQESSRLRRIARELPSVPASELRAADFSAWKVWKLDQSMKNGKKPDPATVRRYMTALNSVLNHAVTEWQVLGFNPLVGVKKPSGGKPRNRVPSEDEITGVLEQLGYDDDAPVETHQQQIGVTLLLALETAMRAGEMLSLDRETVDYQRRVVTLIDTKNGDQREVPLSLRAIELLKKVDPEYFTVSSAVHSQLFRRAVQNAGIENLRFHDSRAAGLMRLSKKVDVLTLARIVGHRDVRSLMIYYRRSAEDIAYALD